jgi:FixJ family two-component response regulator
VLSEQSVIAIVDDDRSFLDSMRRVLVSLGYDVAAFSSAAEFLASSRVVYTTSLIADVQMPGMSGVELYAYLIATGHAIPTILVTGRSDTQFEERMRTSGVKCCLRKPLDEALLIACLRSACTRDDGSRNIQ